MSPIALIDGWADELWSWLHRAPAPPAPNLPAPTRPDGPVSPITEPQTMPRVFKDVIMTDDSTKLDRDAKKKAADDAANAYAAAQAVVGKAENDTLAALVFLGGKASVANADGETISNYFVDKDSPVGYSIDVVPDGAVAEIPDAPAPDGPPAVTPPPPPQPLPESPPPPPSPVESNAGPQPIAVAVDPLTQAMSRTRQ